MAEKYPDNRIKWTEGDIVIHRADAKEVKMLMMVVRTNKMGESNWRMISTIYLKDVPKPRDLPNMHNKKIEVWMNDFTALLDPHDFGLTNWSLADDKLKITEKDERISRLESVIAKLRKCLKDVS
jgi:hypothetical protein